MLLHVTNGDAAGDMLAQAFPGDAVLPWRDALHDGPLRSDLPLGEFSKVRADFLAGCGFGSVEHILAEFKRRDQTLGAFQSFEETVLWFEHDLYDQLQLIQILDWFRGRECRLSLVQTSDYLGPMTPGELKALFPTRRPVTPAQCQLATAAWLAFGSSDLRDLEEFLKPKEALPHLAAAVRRFCEEFPWTQDGLTRTERTIGQLRSAGHTDPQRLFQEFQKTEDPKWMGDSWFFRRLTGTRDRAGGWLWDATRQRLVRRPS